MHIPMSRMPDWWGHLSRMGKTVLVGTVVCTLASIGIALFHPEATLQNTINATIVLAVLWTLFLILARDEIATARLSDHEYFIKKYE